MALPARALEEGYGAVSATAEPQVRCKLNASPMRDQIKVRKAGATGVKKSLAAKREHPALRQHWADAALTSSMNHGAAGRSPAKRVLVIDVGGTSVKILATGQKNYRSFRSGPTLTPARMVSAVKRLAADWTYDVVSIGVPGPVLGDRSVGEPRNLGRGWVGFDFARAFAHPAKVVNDAAMQALGSYKGGKMLFLGLGTGLGTAMIVDGVVTPMEVGHLPYKKSTYEDYVGRAGLKHRGKKKWRRYVADVVERLISALRPDDTVIGGGNVTKLKELPANCRPGENANAFRGGFLLWANDSVVSPDRAHSTACEGPQGTLRRTAASENSPTQLIKRSARGSARSQRDDPRKAKAGVMRR
jgi:polyphosphate glucokinase